MIPCLKAERLGIELDWQDCRPHAPPLLTDQEVHLWLFPLQLGDEQVEHALELLNNTQRDKYFRRKTPQLKQTYIAGRYYLMTLLAAYQKIDPQEIQLSYSRLNKPYLNPNPLDLQFNFTDTTMQKGNIGLFAFARNHAIGVDIEAFSRRSNFAAIVNRRFSQAETAYVTRADGSVDARRFLAYWTRKEAYGKAIGQGINFNMRETDLASPGLFELNFSARNNPQQQFRLRQIQIDNDLIVTLVNASHQNLPIQAFRAENQAP